MYAHLFISVSCFPVSHLSCSASMKTEMQALPRWHGKAWQDQGLNLDLLGLFGVGSRDSYF